MLGGVSTEIAVLNFPNFLSSLSMMSYFTMFTIIFSTASSIVIVNGDNLDIDIAVIDVSKPSSECHSKVISDSV